MRRRPPSQPPGVSGFLLDEFSQADLRKWKNYSAYAEQFNLQLFHHLESLREIHSEELAISLQRCIKRVKRQSWWRLVDYRYSIDALSSRGSLIKGGRFNIGADQDARKFPVFPALYMAEDYPTARAEYFSVSANGFEGHELALVPQHSFAAVKLSFDVRNIFDLSKPSNLNEFTKIISKFRIPDYIKDIGRHIGRKPPWLINSPKLLKDSLLADNWREFPVQYETPANSQVFGRVLRNAGVEGVLYPSAKGRKKCLAIFTENLDGSESFIELADQAPPGVPHTRLDSDNWETLSSLK